MANDLSYYIDKIKFLLTGGVLLSELTDESYAQIMNIALEEVNNYYNATALVLVPAAKCIDLTEVELNNNISIRTITSIHRTRANGTSQEQGQTSDPMYNQFWNTAYALGPSQKWLYSYMTYNTLLQISNTVSTDLDYREDAAGRKLYVNYTDAALELTLEYIPYLKNVSEVNGPHWIDVLSKLGLAIAKITLGRIRTRFTQSNALWSQDGEKLLDEGNNELSALRERLKAQDDYILPLD